jgi:hypothetical protein
MNNETMSARAKVLNLRYALENLKELYLQFCPPTEGRKLVLEQLEEIFQIMVDSIENAAMQEE